MIEADGCVCCQGWVVSTAGVSFQIVADGEGFLGFEKRGVMNSSGANEMSFLTRYLVRQSQIEEGLAVKPACVKGEQTFAAHNSLDRHETDNRKAPIKTRDLSFKPMCVYVMFYQTCKMVAIAHLPTIEPLAPGASRPTRNSGIATTDQPRNTAVTSCNRLCKMQRCGECVTTFVCGR